MRTAHGGNQGSRKLGAGRAMHVGAVVMDRGASRMRSRTAGGRDTCCRSEARQIRPLPGRRAAVRATRRAEMGRWLLICPWGEGGGECQGRPQRRGRKERTRQRGECKLPQVSEVIQKNWRWAGSAIRVGRANAAVGRGLEKGNKSAQVERAASTVAESGRGTRDGACTRRPPWPRSFVTARV